MIREIKSDELQDILHLCDMFSDSSVFVSYDKEIFLSNWSALIDNGIGCILTNDKNNAMLGCIKYPDINTGELCATELFWFSSNPGAGIKLLRKFEEWAKDNNCISIIMVHLADLMPEKVKNIYEKYGYSKMETHYIKRLTYGD
jgi:hypothetical protein